MKISRKNIIFFISVTSASQLAEYLENKSNFARRHCYPFFITKFLPKALKFSSRFSKLNLTHRLISYGIVRKFE